MGAVSHLLLEEIGLSFFLVDEACAGKVQRADPDVSEGFERLSQHRCVTGGEDRVAQHAHAGQAEGGGGVDGGLDVVACKTCVFGEALT